MREIPFHRPSITENDIASVVDCMKSGWLTTGPRAKAFEAEFASYVGASNAVALNSCTAALHLALEAIGVKKGDRVLTTPMTFAATAEVIRYFDAEPELVDIEPSTMNMSVEKLDSALKGLKKVKAIVPVHFAGQPCDMDEIMHIARRRNIRVIEDSAHALPASYKGKSIGTIGDITCFSFYATKNITTGEGGMAVTENPEWADRMRIMGLHGISKDAWKRYTSEGNWYYEIEAPGYKYNLTDVAASLGSSQLRKADAFLNRRAEISGMYTKAFSSLPQMQTPECKPDRSHSWHLYVIKLNLSRLKINRDDFISELKKRGVGASVHFIPLHIHPYYRNKYGFRPEDYPGAYGTYTRIISLPIYPAMTDDDANYVVEAVTDVCSKYTA